MVKKINWVLLAIGWAVNLVALGAQYGQYVNYNILYIVAIIFYVASVIFVLFKFFKQLPPGCDDNPTPVYADGQTAIRL